MPDLFIRRVRLNPPEVPGAYYNSLPAVCALQKKGGLCFESPVTFLVGENGSGKSTLLEAIATAAGCNPEGGGRNYNYATRETHAGMWRDIQLVRSPRRERYNYFLRAESFYTLASYLEAVDQSGLSPDAGIFEYYGGKNLHEVSHGEAFLGLVLNRLEPQGLYFFDEPEAALSPANQLTLLAGMHSLVQRGSQFIIATHSPMLMAYPGADVLVLGGGAIQKMPYKKTAHYEITTRFLAEPDSILKTLLADDAEDEKTVL